MSFLLALIISLILFYLFWFLGHVVRKELKINEDNQLLANLINICLGASGFLITINLTSSQSKRAAPIRPEKNGQESAN